MPPNCFREVEDVVKEWTWSRKFDLIYMRFMLGAFSDDEWKEVYSKAYDSLNPGVRVPIRNAIFRNTKRLLTHQISTTGLD